jgi:AcrR family transcriptional regulator
MNTHSPVIRRGRKFDQVLEGAREVFLRDGFEGASVDEIAKVAGVSKATLYSYFPDKAVLFREIATNQCDRMADEILAMLTEDCPLREALLIAAERLASFLVSDVAQGVFRICVAERDRFPELGAAFYEAGPRMGRDRMAAFLECAVADGALQIDDVKMAAEQFSELCKSTIWNKAVFGIQSEFSQEEIRNVAENAVETFLARYGVSQA